MVFKLEVTDLFKDDLSSALDYISTELCNFEASKKLFEKVDSSIIQILEFPYSCPIVQNTFIPRKDVHRKVIDSYSLYYVIEEKTKIVVLLRFILSRRDTKA